jgi:hypothetical protein
MVATVTARVPGLALLCRISIAWCVGGGGREGCRNRRWGLPEHVGESPKRVGALSCGDGLDQGTATVIDPLLDHNACL